MNKTCKHKFEDDGDNLQIVCKKCGYREDVKMVCIPIKSKQMRKQINKLNYVKDIYNDRQDEYDLSIPIDNNLWICKRKKERLGKYIGFYEWLFNPKYKVFEVFHIDPDNLINSYTTVGHTQYSYGIHPSKEIIDYMYKELKSEKK